MKVTVKIVQGEECVVDVSMNYFNLSSFFGKQLFKTISVFVFSYLFEFGTKIDMNFCLILAIFWGYVFFSILLFFFR